MSGETDTRNIPTSVRWILYAVSQVGFPIAVALFLLLSVGKKLDDIAAKLDRLILVTEARR